MASLRRRVNRVACASWLVSVLFHVLLVYLLLISWFPRTERTPLQLQVNPPEVGSDLVILDATITEPDAQHDPLMIEVIGDMSSASLHIPSPMGQLASGADGQGQHQTTAGIRTGARGGEGRATFFGTVAEGDRFVYIVDVSSSMSEGNGRRLNRAVQELLRSVGQLRGDQSFFVLLFSSETRPMFDERAPPRWLMASDQNKQRLRNWMLTVSPAGGTYPHRALSIALQLRPSAVFFLSDGNFSRARRRDRRTRGMRASDVVTRVSGNKTPIHTVAFEDPASKYKLQQLSEQTSGQYHYVESPRDIYFKEYRAILASADKSDVGKETAAVEWLKTADRYALEDRAAHAQDLYLRIMRKFPSTEVAKRARQRHQALVASSHHSNRPRP